MTEAAPLPTSAISAGNGYGDNQEIVALFGLWCRAIQFTPGPEYGDDRRQQAIRDRIDERQRLEASISRVAMRSDLGKSALLWMTTLRLVKKCDPANPTLPHSDDKEHRRLVMQIAQLHPELARSAGLAMASGNFGQLST